MYTLEKILIPMSFMGIGAILILLAIEFEWLTNEKLFDNTPPAKIHIQMVNETCPVVVKFDICVTPPTEK